MYELSKEEFERIRLKLKGKPKPKHSGYCEGFDTGEPRNPAFPAERRIIWCRDKATMVGITSKPAHLPYDCEYFQVFLCARHGSQDIDHGSYVVSPITEETIYATQI